jgi:hypothetical protein
MIASAANGLPVVEQGQKQADQQPSIICICSDIKMKIFVFREAVISDWIGRYGKKAYLGEHLAFTTDIAVRQ